MFTGFPAMLQNLPFARRASSAEHLYTSLNNMANVKLTANQGTNFSAGTIKGDLSVLVTGPNSAHYGIRLTKAPPPYDFWKDQNAGSERAYPINGEAIWIFNEGPGTIQVYDPLVDVEAQLRSLGADEEMLRSLAGSKVREPQRPGTFEGNHFFDLGDAFLWRSGPDGDKCGDANWFKTAKQNGDAAEMKGRCPSGLDWYRITLVV
jgi:hypothetical protein